MSSTSSLPPSVASGPFELSLNDFGRLRLRWPDGRMVEGVAPVRAFPLQAPEQGIALVDGDGHEVAWIESLAELPQPAQGLIREVLRMREFMPRIEALLSVTSFATPCTWEVRTDRGHTRFVLRGEEDIRRIRGGEGLLITDSHGIQFQVPDLGALGRDSRRLLDRFL